MSKTIIIIILDESGSMFDKKADTMGGFNEFIENQKENKTDQAKLYLVKFNTVVAVVHRGINLENVPKLTSTTYTPGGGTALYDAIAEAVRLVDKKKGTDERVLCVIMTDGEENSSKETTKQQVKEIISGYEARGDWTFLYIGENPEKWTTDTGMSRAQGISYEHSDVAANYRRLDVAAGNLRSSASKQAMGINLFRKK